jgi:hypothetical protein
MSFEGVCNMRKMVQLILLFSITMSFMLISKPSIVYACSCAEPPSVETQVERSEAVFAGRVLEVAEQKSARGYMTKAALFEVGQIWKGGAESQIVIHTGSGGGDCGYYFEAGKDYLVYAHSTEMYGDKDQLVTIICDRTGEYTETHEDLAVLGEGRAPTEQVNLERELPGGLAGVWIVLGGVVAVIVVLLYAWRRAQVSK